MTLNATQLGYDGTLEALRTLLAERFDISFAPSAGADQQLFAIGLGLSSLDGIEFLCEVEKRFDVRIKDLEWWVYETPTLNSVAQYVVDLSRQQHATG